MSDEVRRFLEQQGQINSHTEALRRAMGLHDLAIARIDLASNSFGAINSAQALARFDEVRRELREFERLREAAAGPLREIEAAFRRPDVVEAMALAKQVFDASNAASAEVRRLMDATGLEAKMLAMQDPWLTDRTAVSSAFAFTQIQALGLALNSAPYKALATSARGILGDWRDVVPIPADIASVSTRLNYYSERGVSDAVRTLSPSSFEEAADIAGFDRFIAEDNKSEDEEYHFSRNLEAFDTLQRFETAMRNFIVEVMTSVFGETWIKHQVPGDMREKWESKKQIAVNAGEVERPLIEYADFTDYRGIIERKDNWDKAFKPIFRRMEDIRESLQRLYPVRISTMHARMITNEDKVLLLFETKRIMKAITLSS